MRRLGLRDFNFLNAEELLEHYVAEVEFRRGMLCLGAIRPLLFKIYIDSGSGNDDEEGKITLIHELIHAFCMINWIKAKDEEIDSLAKDIVSNHPQAVETLLCKLHSGEKSGTWQNPILRIPKSEP